MAVPHHAGRGIVEAAARRRVHVLKEKPLATSLDEARELAWICDDAGIQLMVTLQRRFNPIYTSFLQLADRIGTPFVVDAEDTALIQFGYDSGLYGSLLLSRFIGPKTDGSASSGAEASSTSNADACAG